MRFARMHAGGKCVQSADPMGQPVLHQKIQRAISHRRLVPEPLGGKPLQHVIGTQRAMFFQKDLQHPKADRRQLDTLRLRQRLGPRQYVIAAMPVIMPGKGHVRRAGAAGAIVGMGV